MWSTAPLGSLQGSCQEQPYSLQGSKVPCIFTACTAASVLPGGGALFCNLRHTVQGPAPSQHFVFASWLSQTVGSLLLAKHAAYCPAQQTNIYAKSDASS